METSIQPALASWLATSQTGSLSRRLTTHDTPALPRAMPTRYTIKSIAKAYVELPTRPSTVRVQSTSDARAVAPLAASTPSTSRVSPGPAVGSGLGFRAGATSDWMRRAETPTIRLRHAASRVVLRTPISSIDTKLTTSVPSAAPRVLAP